MKEFVHHAQEEVGRQRVVSDTAAAAGFEMDIDVWLADVEAGGATAFAEKWL